MGDAEVCILINKAHLDALPGRIETSELSFVQCVDLPGRAVDGWRMVALNTVITQCSDRIDSKAVGCKSTRKALAADMPAAGAQQSMFVLLKELVDQEGHQANEVLENDHRGKLQSAGDKMWLALLRTEAADWSLNWAAVNTDGARAEDCKSKVQASKCQDLPNWLHRLQSFAPASTQGRRASWIGWTDWARKVQAPEFRFGKYLEPTAQGSEFRSGEHLEPCHSPRVSPR